MPPRIPNPAPSRPPCTCKHQQTRQASLYRRPLRPYTFTQIVQLSDGSTYTQRTTSPLPVLRSTKDTRNTLLWQPTLASLRNVEKDEAGRLAAFREKFGRGWDAGGERTMPVPQWEESAGGEISGDKGLRGEVGEGRVQQGDGQGEGDLMDLISMGGWSRGDAGMGAMPEKKGVEREKKMITVMRGGKLVKVAAMSTGEKKAAAAGKK